MLTGASGQVQKATDYCAADAKGAVGIPNAEFWGDVVRAAVKPGGTGHEAPTAAACCNACASARGCNGACAPPLLLSCLDASSYRSARSAPHRARSDRHLTRSCPPSRAVWVWCNNPASCGTQCWLKRVGDPSSGAAKPHAKGEGVSWTSGVLDGKDPDVDPAKLPPPDASVTTVALRTAEGDIRLKLMPEWSQDSVDYVRLVAKNHLCSPQCASCSEEGRRSSLSSQQSAPHASFHEDIYRSYLAISHAVLTTYNPPGGGRRRVLPSGAWFPHPGIPPLVHPAEQGDEEGAQDHGEGGGARPPPSAEHFLLHPPVKVASGRQRGASE